MRPTRHIHAFAGVDPSIIELAARIWGADDVNGRLCETDTLLVLFDPVHCTPSAFIDTLTAANERGVPLGVIPIYSGDAQVMDLTRLLGNDRMAISLSHCRFRLSGSVAANAMGAPSILSRAAHDSPMFVNDDIDQADLLFLQGHAGPFDGSFGRWLTLCSKNLHKSGMPAFVPCAGTDQCFRQQSQGRDGASSEGLIDPRRLRSALVVADGCGTFPVPGSLYRYQQSLLRGLMLSSVQASVLSVGVSATPLSVVVLFMAMLARGRTLGQAVMDANRNRRQTKSPSSIEGVAAAPWVLVGNPAAVVTGIPLTEYTAERTNDGKLQFVLPREHTSADTGTLVALNRGIENEDPLDVTCFPHTWAHGALHNDGYAYLWAGTSAVPSGVIDATSDTRVMLSRRSPLGPVVWRERLFWLRVCSQWLQGVADCLDKRKRDSQPLLEIVAVRDELATPIELAAYAATPYRNLEIAVGLDTSTEVLVKMLSKVDRATAMTVGAAIPFAGARLSHLWTPPWIHAGYADIQETCLCGCTLSGHVRRHPLYDLLRIEVSCPTCSLVGDTAAESNGSASDVNLTRPVVRASMLERLLVPGHSLRWFVERLLQDQFDGFACATLFDPFRVRHAMTDPIEIGPCSARTISLNIPADWPTGLAWATLAFTAGGRICLFAFDVEIQPSPLE